MTTRPVSLIDPFDSIASSPDIEDDRIKHQITTILKRKNLNVTHLLELPLEKLRQLFSDAQVLSAVYTWRSIEKWKFEKLPEESTLFHAAAKTGNLVAARQILTRHDMPAPACRKYLADHVNVANSRRTPLFDAVINGHPGMVRLLGEELKANILLKDATNSLAIHLAAEMGRLHCVMFLVELCPDLLNWPDGANNTPLNRAALNGQIAVVEYLVANNKQCYIENYDNKGRTPLLQAASNGHLNVVRLLVAKGADLFAKEPYNDNTAIHLAAEAGHTGVVAFLSEINPEFRKIENKSGKTALDLAKEQNHGDIVRIFDGAAANPDIITNNDISRRISLPLPSPRLIQEEPIVTTPP